MGYCIPLRDNGRTRHGLLRIPLGLGSVCSSQNVFGLAAWMARTARHLSEHTCMTYLFLLKRFTE